MLAPLSYALWFRDAKPQKRPSIRKYLHEMGLDDYPEDNFLWNLKDSAPTTSKKPAPTLTEQEERAKRVEEWLKSHKPENEESDPNKGWGEFTLADIRAYKAEKARKKRRAKGLPDINPATWKGGK